jgi:hypothetical protein
MGLDLVEFVISVEDTFQIQIPDADAQTIATPRYLINYLTGRLPSGKSPPCLSQRAFYQLGSIIRRHLNLPRHALRPNTNLLDIFPTKGHAELWKAIGDEVGARKYWPRLGKPGWLERVETPRLNRFADIVRFMVARNPCLLLREGEGWTRHKVAEVVHGLIREQLGVRRDQYTEDSRWGSDMGIA